MVDQTRAAAFATPVYIAPALGVKTVNIKTAVTTMIKAGAATAVAINVNTGAGAGTIKLYDGDPAGAGVLLGTFSAAAAINLPLGSGGFVVANGLYAVTNGVADITVSYY